MPIRLPSSYATQLYEEYARNAETSLKRLLETKHLYQNESVPIVPKERVVAAAAGSWPQGLSPDSVHSFQFNRWDPINPSRRGTPPFSSGQEVPLPLEFTLPRIECYCCSCEMKMPFAPAAIQMELEARAASSHKKYYDQFFVLPYQCQRCVSTPEIFLVGKLNNKLTLAGRLPIEKIAGPDYLPKSVRDHYTSALHAFNVGAALPALFMLRVLIEQFAFSELKRKNAYDAVEGDRGVNYMEAYSGTLPKGLRESAPSLKVIYERLSAAMHEANADEALFHESLQQIHEHFDGRRYFKADN